METIKKKIDFDKKIGTEVSQILIEGDIIVPDVKPDIELLLTKSANAYINSREITNERVNFKGNIDIEVLYISKTSDNPIHSMYSTTPINDFISIDGIDKNSLVNTKCDITNIEYKVVNDRKVSFRAVLDVKIDVVGTQNNEVVIDVEGINASQVKKKVVNVNKIKAFNNDKFVIKDEFVIPGSKPNIDELLLSSISICNKEIKAVADKVAISGELKISCLYKSSDDEGVIEFLENEIPFNGLVPADEIAENMVAEAILDLQEKVLKVKSDDSGEDRIIDVDITIGTSVSVFESTDMEILEDAYCINKCIDIEKVNVEYPSFVCKNKFQAPVKEIIKIEDDSPGILQIINVNGNTQIDEIKMVEDKIVVEGIVYVDILYVTGNDEIPLYSYETVVPFRQVMEARGVSPEKAMLVDIDRSIEHIGVNMLSDKEVELRCVINFDMYAQEEIHDEIIEDVVFNDLDRSILDNIASMTIYVVQKGDTLWKIAKRYNTSIDEIVKINDIENPDKIYPGQRLLILKRYE